MARPCARRHPVDLGLARRGVRGRAEGRNPSVGQAAAAIERGRGRCRPATRRRGPAPAAATTDTSSKEPAGPSWLTTSPAHRRRSTGNAVLHLLGPGRGRDADGAALAADRRARARRSSRKRPPDSTSSVATALASHTRLRPGSSMVVPILSPGQAPDAQASPTSGSGPGRVSTSGNHSESNPHPVIPCANATMASGPRSLPHRALMPMRIFIGASTPGLRWRAPRPRRPRRGA